MGNNCSTFEPKDQYQFLSQFISPTFGPLKLLHNSTANKDFALKYFHFPSLQDLNQYLSLINSPSSLSYSKIPTLLKTISCLPDSKLSCQSFGCYLTFEYYPKSVNIALKEKKIQLKRFQKTYYGEPEYGKLRGLYFWDYKKIDKSGMMERKYCNIHFLEIQVLRMIDHVLGALYFLHHVNAEENAIRPENIMIDDQGKYLLVNKKLFRLRSNYELVLYEGKNVPFLSPQELRALKSKAIEPRISYELSNIFSIGVIALEMCTLDSLEKLYDFKEMKLNVMELNRLMSNAKQHYSSDFMELLGRMLEINVENRIDFSTLIDCLNPILVNNIENQVKVYGENWVKDSEMDLMSSKSNKTQKSHIFNSDDNEHNNQKRLSNVQKRLEQIDEKYNQVMGIKVVQKVFNLKQEYFARDEESVLGKLQEVKKEKQKQSKNRGMEKKKVKGQQQIKGSELYDMFVKEYNSINESRIKLKRESI